MSFDKKNNVMIIISNDIWKDSKKYELVLTLNPKISKSYIEIEKDEPEIKNFDKANEILKKFML
jgi:hypothetical protein